LAAECEGFVTVHLLKLCVGAESVEDMLDWLGSAQPGWPAGCSVHVTRMWPKREAELLDGGSLYWVIKGMILLRQPILGLERVDEGDGVDRCAIVMDRRAVRTEPSPRRPFQGWRYLAPAEAPRDIAAARLREEALPPGMAEALAAFGVR
jgi:hypothetical protein